MTEEVTYWYLMLDGKMIDTYSDLGYCMGAALHAAQEGHRVEVMTRQQWLALTDERDQTIHDVMNAVEEYDNIPKTIEENKRLKYNEIVRLIQKL